MPLILGTNSIKDTGYNVANSLRFDDGSSDSLTKTASTPTNNKKQTSSVWVKRSALSGSSNFGIMGFVDTSSPSNSRHHLYFYNDQLAAFYKDPTITRLDLKTNRLFRDTSAWYHIVLAIDTTQGTASDRTKLYVNGVQETSFATSDYPVQDITFLDSGETLQVGRLTTSGGSQQYFDGYIAEAVFIDGQALDPTSFGEFDSDSPNIWKPIDVSGLTFGTNGFYLAFENASSLGADVSGNSNNFTVNNLTSVDQSTDTCTNNFCTLNPLIGSNNITLSEGNLYASTTSASWSTQSSTFSLSQGKWYLEVYVVGYNHNALGVQFAENASLRATAFPSELAGGFGFKFYDGSKTSLAADSASYGNAVSNGQTVGMALDLDNHKIYFSINGTFQNSGVPTSGSTGTGSAFDLTTGKDYVIYNALNHQPGNAISSFNFGSPPHSISSGNSDANGFGNFEYSVPSGYFSLCTKNLAEFG